MCKQLKQPRSPEERRKIKVYRRLAAVAFTLYICSSVFLNTFIKGPLGIAFAAVSGILFFAILVFNGLLVLRTLDEFQRQLMTQSLLWGTLLTMAFASIYGHIEAFPETHVPHIPLLALPVALILLTSAAKVLIFRRNRSIVD